MHVSRSSQRQLYRLKQRQQIEDSPLIQEKFPRLKGLKVALEYFDPSGTTRTGEMKCKLNVQRASSALWFSCRGGECFGGDFDLSEVLAMAVAGQSKTVSGELRCEGTRERGDRTRTTCQRVLRYRLNLSYC